MNATLVALSNDASSAPEVNELVSPSLYTFTLSTPIFNLSFDDVDII